MSAPLDVRSTSCKFDELFCYLLKKCTFNSISVYISYPQQQHFDFIVVGGGSGGLAAAKRAASYNAKVCIVEKARYGGTCVNVGELLVGIKTCYVDILYCAYLLIPHHPTSSLSYTMYNAGCVPKKVMFNAAHVGEVLKEAKHFGYELAAPAEFHWARLKQARDNYIRRLNGIYESGLDKMNVS